MTEPKFTPGPWTAVQHGEGIYTWTIRGNDEMEDRSLAVVGVGTPNLQRDEANMHLIKAAPEMYNVLNDILHGGFCADKFKTIHEVLCEARGESTESRCGSCKFFKHRISACVIREERPFYVKEETIPCLAYEPRKESEVTE